MSYTSEKLQSLLAAFPSPRRYWLAYSGGCDSQVLLHSLSTLHLPGVTLQAIHIDHGLQDMSADWSKQCVSWAQALGVSCRVIKVDARHQVGESPEDAARKARYEALGSLLDEGDVLLTAHHCDDQAETLLLQLLRGSGSLGLSAMARMTPLTKGSLYRPLLAFTRVELEEYARQQGLVWIDDPSNEFTKFDRNYLRHEVTPRLAVRWPSWQRVIARTATHQVEMAQLSDDLAIADLRETFDDQQRLLKIDHVLALAEYRQRNLLRYWIRQSGLPLPTTQQLYHIQSDVLKAGIDRSPVVKWPGAEVRRYRGALYVMKPLPEHDRSYSGCWSTRLQSSCRIPTGEITVAQLIAQGLARAELDREPLRICYRRGGEKIRLRNKVIHQDLKTLFQQAGVPPWIRSRVPLVYRGDRLLAVVGYWLGE